jgi:TorA maturation chaperone TorD
MRSPITQGWCDSYAAIRMDSYVMLAALLSRPPSEELMRILQNLSWEEALPTNLDNALDKLREAGRTYSLSAVEEEFNRLFVGLGSGEVVPYASWYRERKMQALPLASLRSDLMTLGIVRQAETREYEDQAGVLFEIMALICRNPDDVPHDKQAAFFQRHVAPWMMSFFNDLYSAESAGFYRAVALLGRCFLEWESEYLSENNRPY